MPEDFRYEKNGPVTTITFNRPERRNCMNRQVMTELEALVPLAPLHQPHHIAAIRAIKAAAPEVPQGNPEPSPVPAAGAPAQTPTPRGSGPPAENAPTAPGNSRHAPADGAALK